MTLDQYLAERVVESVFAKLDLNAIMEMSDDSLFEFAKNTGRKLSLKMSAEAANLDVFDFAESVRGNKSFNQIACNVSDRIVSNEVIMPRWTWSKNISISGRIPNNHIA